MNKLIPIILIFSVICAASCFAQDFTAKAIVDKVNQLLNQDQVKAIMKMTITTSSGDTRTFTYESYSKDNGEKNLIKYIAPSRVKDQAVLMLNNADDIWSYFPRTNRVRKLATHAKKQKFEGSDFSYEDMGSGDSWLTDFVHTRLEDDKFDGNECFVIELTAKPDAETGYSRQVMWVQKADYYPIRIDYYDEDDSSYQTKRLILTDIRSIEGIPTAMKMVMYNLEDNTSTTSEYDEVTYNIKLDNELFTERGMKK